MILQTTFSIFPAMRKRSGKENNILSDFNTDLVQPIPVKPNEIATSLVYSYNLY